ncbi:Uncharacterised protein [Bordetella pertussis]|nr:Uncharacterised protein [Bordetella pertussis]CPM35873.1 Uncharacterised protein [Bordetella pertussis]
MEAKANAFHPSKDPGRPGRTMRVQRCGPGSRQAPVRSLAARQFRRHELGIQPRPRRHRALHHGKGLWLQDRGLAHRDPAGAGRPGARRPRHQYRNLAQQRCRPLGPRPEDRQGQAGGRALHGRRSLVRSALHRRAPARAEVGGRPAQVQGPFQGPRGARQGALLWLSGGLGLRSDQHQPVPCAQAG